MRSFFPALTLACVLLQACERQKLPEPAETEPVFVFEALVDNQEQKLQAGTEEYYQFTSFTSPSGDFPCVWQGELRKSDCGGCGPAINIKLFDIQQRISPSEEDVLTALTPGDRVIRFLEIPGGTSISGSRLLLNAIAPPPGNDLSYRWIFSDGEIAYTPSAVRKIKRSGNESITLIVSKAGYPNDTLKNEISFNSPTEACLASFEHIRLSGNLFRLIAPSGFNSYSWDIEGNTYDGRIIDVDLSAFSKASVMLTAVKNNCSSVFSRKIAVNSGFSEAIADMEAKTEVQSFPADSLNIPFGQAEITWTKPGGIVFSSTRKTQNPSQQSFRILSRTSFEKNESGEKTLKLELSFAGYLYRVDQPGDSIFMQTKKWVAGIAFP